MLTRHYFDVAMSAFVYYAFALMRYAAPTCCCGEGRRYILATSYIHIIVDIADRGAAAIRSALSPCLAFS